jgi:hypothetical protein
VLEEEDTMQATLRASAHTAPISTTRRWVGRVISGLAVLFLVIDGVVKALALEPAVAATAQLGYPERLTAGIGLLELACLVVHLIPRAAPIGAILLTGFLGGAVATHLRVGSEPFSVVFPVIIGALLWVGLYLRDARLRALVAPRS